MFKNPIKKYQSGGNIASPQQQQQIEQLFQAASKNTGIDINTLVDAANQLKDENQIKQYFEAISLAAQGNKAAIDTIKKMFTQSASQFSKGGKFNDFICKHGKGGALKADCGCKKAEDGMSLEPPVYLYNEKGVPVEMNSITGREGRVLTQESATPIGKVNYTWNELNKSVPNGLTLPVEYGMQKLHMLGDGAMSVQPIRGFERDLETQKINRWKSPVKKDDNGGIVKAQGGEKVPYGIIDYRDSDGVGRTYQWYDGSPLTKMYLETDTRFDPVTKLHHTDSSFTHFFLPEDVFGTMDQADKKSGIWHIKDSSKYKNPYKVVPFLRKKWEDLTKGYKK